MRSRGIRVAVMSVLILCLSSPAYADDPEETPPPEELLSVSTASANGSGCRGGTHEIDTLPNNRGFRIRHKAFKATAGEGSTAVDFRKNCQLSMHVRVPDGYSYAIIRTASFGTLDIGAGARALQRGTFYYSGSPSTAYRTHQFAGPLTSEWETTDEIDISERIWSPCREARLINANSELRVTKSTAAPTDPIFMELDSAIYHISWRRC